MPRKVTRKLITTFLQHSLFLKAVLVSQCFRLGHFIPKHFQSLQTPTTGWRDGDMHNSPEKVIDPGGNIAYQRTRKSTTCPEKMEDLQIIVSNHNYYCHILYQMPLPCMCISTNQLIPDYFVPVYTSSMTDCG